MTDRSNGSNDPGAHAAGARAEDVENAAATPLEIGGGGHIRIGTASWTDPTMTAAGVFYPTSADDRRRATPALRRDLPAGRGRRHLLRAAGRRHGQAVGRSDAARLRLRHQGPRADDRPGHRDETPAEGHPRRASGACRDQGEDLRQGPSARRPRRRLAGVPGRAGAARRGRPARLDPAPVPALVLPLVGEPGRDRGGRGAARWA